MRRTWIHLRFSGVVLTLISMVVTGCTTPSALPSELKRFRRFSARLARVTPAGEILLKNGAVFGLACVKMRSLAETEEEDLVSVVNTIIIDHSDEVEVEVDVSSRKAVVYYWQRIHYFDTYGVGLLRTMWMPRFARGTINELLILMGAARYAEPGEGECISASARKACVTAEEKAEEAMHSQWRYRPLSEYASGRCGQLYTDRHGYRARITKGDIDERDRNVRVGKSFCATFVSMTPGHESVVVLVDSLLNENLVVRRCAVRALAGMKTDPDAQSALLRAQNDRDRYVREYASRALGR